MNNLNNSQLHTLHQILLELQEHLTQSLDQTASSATTVTLDQQRFGRVSRIDAIQQQHMAQAGEHQIRLKLKQVMAALLAIDEDEYGLCRSCDSPIGYLRLEVRPETPLCIKCQQNAENRQ